MIRFRDVVLTSVLFLIVFTGCTDNPFRSTDSKPDQMIAFSTGANLVVISPEGDLLHEISQIPAYQYSWSTDASMLVGFPAFTQYPYLIDLESSTYNIFEKPYWGGTDWLDGTRFIALRSDSLFVINAQTLESEFLHRGSNPHLSPNKRKLAYTHDGHVYIRDLESSESHRIVDAALEPGNYRWAPKSNFLAIRKGSDLWRYSPDGPGIRLTENEEPILHVEWSPFGNRIAYINNRHELIVINADGSGKTILAEEVSIRDFSWSPDARYIAFHTSEPINERRSTTNITIVPSDGGEVRLLAENAMNARWLQSHNQVVYFDMEERSLIRSDPDGQNRFVIFENDASAHFSLSPVAGR